MILSTAAASSWREQPALSASPPISWTFEPKKQCTSPWDSLQYSPSLHAAALPSSVYVRGHSHTSQALDRFFGRKKRALFVSCAFQGVARVVEEAYDAVNARYMLLAGDNRVRAISSQEGAVRVSRCKPDVYYKSRDVCAHDDCVRCARTPSFCGGDQSPFSRREVGYTI